MTIRLLRIVPWLATLAVLLAGGAYGQSHPPPELPGEIFLSWHMPYGMPGASDTLSVSCDDTSRVDTLYLSFRPGGRNAKLFWTKAVLYFHPQGEDTLGPFWWFKRGSANEKSLYVDFDRIAGFPAPVAWGDVGYGEVSYDHQSGRGRLDMQFRAPVGSMVNTIVNEETYCYARVKIIHKRPQLNGCRQPVCVEFASLVLGYAGKKTREITEGDHRIVSWNSPAGACQGSGARVKAWLPKKIVIPPGLR